MNPLFKSTCLALCGLLFIGLWLALIPERNQPLYRAAMPKAGTHAGPVFKAHWVTGGETPQVHSANVAMVGGTPVTIWYGGTEEGHRDVALFLSTFKGQWSAPRQFADVAGSRKGLGRYIRKVGNPALHVWPDGSLGVFYVSVSVGGWAASAVNYMETPDLGDTWSRPRRLVTSPFLNLSTLVRTHGLGLRDGTLQLPVYHEFIGKFSEVLHLNRSVTVLNKTRISRGRHSLQPAIASLSDRHSLALLRYAGDPPARLLAASSRDGGRSWSAPVKLALANPNAAVAQLRLTGGRLLLAFNDTEDGRNRLSLAVREAGAWRVVRTVEAARAAPGSHEYEFSYPSLAMDDDGYIHLVYTWNQRRIRHLRFNDAWLAGESH